jgi:hypothetical protein
MGVGCGPDADRMQTGCGPGRCPMHIRCYFGFHMKYTGTPSSTMISPGHVVAVR